MGLAYCSNLDSFLDDIDSGKIEQIILQGFKRIFGRTVAINEINSWRNSLEVVGAVLRIDTKVPELGVGIELQIDGTAKRIDLLFSGYAESGMPTTLLIELKQWSSAEITELDGIVSTYIGGGDRQMTHPSYQAWSYASLLRDFNVEVYENNISIIPCAFLHNYVDNGAITDNRYSEYLDKAPVFLRHNRRELLDYIWENISIGDPNQDILRRIDKSPHRPSRSLADGVQDMIQGNDYFTLIDDQKLAYETVLDASIQSRKDNIKRVILVNGGPGTGKSVVAINLLTAGINAELNSLYLSKNSAPRLVYHRRLSGRNMSRARSLFQGTGSFYNTEANAYDLLIIDEAHRMTKKSGMFQNLGEDQVMEVIKSSRTSVFFIDEAQRVHIKDHGTITAIRESAVSQDAEVIELELSSQFRCNGSDGYLAWIEQTLGIRDTANTSFEDFIFEVVDTAQELREIIQSRDLEENSTARMVAGYCWPWVSKKYPHEFDFILENGFTARWNLEKHGQAWLDIPESINEIGCIHTCQGLEVDYIGVIIGPDLVISGDGFSTNVDARAPHDTTVRGRKAALKRGEITEEDLDKIIRNTYRCLMTRGMKGCYVYCTDPEMNSRFRQLIAESEDSIID